MNDNTELAQLEALLNGITDETSLLANGAAFLNQILDRINWVGFYILKNNELVLGPFQGKPACTHIAIGKGVCGTAVARDEIMRIDNVEEFPGHIACDSASRSEIVIPLHREGEVIGVLDIDSPELGRFTAEDQEMLSTMAACIEKHLYKCTNDVVAQLYARKSVRVYEDREISEIAKKTILNAAIQAPTAGNQALYTIIDVTDQEKKEQLAISCDNQPFIAKAKLVLIFAADCIKWYEAYKEAGCEPREPRAGDLFIAMDDALIAAQNAVVAAHSMGIGSCYIGDIMENCEVQREILSLPEYVFPAAMLVFGYPTEQQKQRKKPVRFAYDDIVHENGYRLMDGAELREMFSAHVGERGFDSWIQAFCKRKYHSDFCLEMSRSVEEALKMYIR